MDPARHPLIELGGRGEPLLLMPANGFPPDTYRPLLEPLMNRFRVVSLPPRALWPGSGNPPEHAGSWESLAADLGGGLEEHGLKRTVGIGHSFGAVVLIIAAARAPDRFRGLALLDPTIFPPRDMERLRAIRADGKDPPFSLVEMALQRRNSFSTLEEAFAYWRPKPLFHDWPDDAVWRYVRAGLTRASETDVWTLAWPARWEAWYYRSFYAGTWGDIARLPPTLPVLSIRGERSDTYTAEAESALQGMLSSATIACLPDEGHLFPQANPDAALALLDPWLQACGLDSLTPPGRPVTFEKNGSTGAK